MKLKIHAAFDPDVDPGVYLAHRGNCYKGYWDN